VKLVCFLEDIRRIPRAGLGAILRSDNSASVRCASVGAISGYGASTQLMDNVPAGKHQGSRDHFSGVRAAHCRCNCRGYVAIAWRL